MAGFPAIDRRYAALLGLGALDAAGYGMIGPIVPEIAEATNAGPAVMGGLVATFGIGMVIGCSPRAHAVHRFGAVLVCGASLAVTMILGALASRDGRQPPDLLLRAVPDGNRLGRPLDGDLPRSDPAVAGNEYRRLSGLMAVYSVGGHRRPGDRIDRRDPRPISRLSRALRLGVAVLPVIGPPSRHAPAFGSDRTVLRSPAFAVSAAAMVLIAVTIGTLDGVLPLHFASELGQAGIAALFVGTSLVVALFALLGARFRLRPTMAVAVSAIVIGLAIAGVGDEVWIWVVGLAVVGMGSGSGRRRRSASCWRRPGRRGCCSPWSSGIRSSPSAT